MQLQDIMYPNTTVDIYIYIYVCVFIWCGVIILFGVTAFQTKTIAWQPTYVWGFYFGNTQHAIKHKPWLVLHEPGNNNLRFLFDFLMIKTLTKNSNPYLGLLLLK